MRAYLATVTSQHVDDERPLFDVGLDSLGTLELIAQLEKQFATTVPPTLLYDHPTIRALSAYFDGLAPDQGAPAPISSGLPDAARDEPAETEPLTEPLTEPRTGPEDLPPLPSNARSATSASALVLQLIGLLVRPALFAVAFVPAVVTFELAARRLSALELLLLGPVWIAAVLFLSMAAAVVLVRFAGIGRPGGTPTCGARRTSAGCSRGRPSAPSRRSWGSCEAPVRSRRSTGSAAPGSGGTFAWSRLRSMT